MTNFGGGKMQSVPGADNPRYASVDAIGAPVGGGLRIWLV